MGAAFACTIRLGTKIPRSAQCSQINNNRIWFLPIRLAKKKKQQKKTTHLVLVEMPRKGCPYMLLVRKYVLQKGWSNLIWPNFQKLLTWRDTQSTAFIASLNNEHLPHAEHFFRFLFSEFKIRSVKAKGKWKQQVAEWCPQPSSFY